jgi:hypothetical protein
MADTPERTDQPKRPHRRRWRRWLVATLVVVAGVLLVLWSRLGGIDARLVGYWTMADGTPCVLDSDGGAYAGADLAKDPKIRRNQKWWVQGDRIYWQVRQDSRQLGNGPVNSLQEQFARMAYMCLYSTHRRRLPLWLVNQFSSDQVVSVDDDTLVLKSTGVLRRVRH